MKRWIAILALAALLCAPGANALAQDANAGEIKLFDGMWTLCKALGDTAAYALDQAGTLWVQSYDEAQPRALLTVPLAPAAYQAGERYEDLSEDDRAQADEVIETLVEAGGTLYAVNRGAGRIGTVDAQGVHWREYRFDTAPFLEPEGWQRVVLSAQARGNTLYLLLECYDAGPDYWQYARVAAIDLSTGQTTVLEAPDASNMCLYGEELLLLCTDAGDQNWLSVLTPQTGEIRRLPGSVPAGAEAGALSYDERTGTAYLAVGAGVYAAALEGDFAIVSNNPEEYSSKFMAGRFLPDGRFALMGGSVHVLPALDASAPRQTLTISLQHLDGALQQAFAQAHPGVLIDLRAQSLPAAEVAERIRSGDTQTDVFAVRVEPAFGDLVSKGYAAALDEQPDIAASVAGMYPQIASALKDGDGRIVAYPLDLTLNMMSVNRALWEKYFGDEALPTTWAAFFDAMLRFEQRENEEGDLFLMEWSYDSVLWKMVQSYMEQHDAPGELLRFDDSALREAIMALDRVRDCLAQRGIESYFEGDLYPESEVVGERSIFALFGVGYSTYKATLSDYNALPPLTFAPDEPPVVRAYMNVLIVNPTSANQALAREFIAAATRRESGLMRYYMLHAAATEPVENENWQEARKRNPAAERWRVSTEGIAGWQRTASVLRFYERSVFLGDAMLAQCQALCARYAGGQLGLDALIEQLDEVSRMVYLEQQ